jgi:protein SCO1
MKRFLVFKVNYKPIVWQILFLLLSATVFGQNVINPVEDVEIGIVEHLDEFLPDSILLINEDQQQVYLNDIIDKPTVINFVYYRCPGICSPLMEAIAGVIDKSELVIGKDYQVLTISFDPTETIDLGIRKKENYLNLMTKKEEAAGGWHFFVSDSASIIRATEAVGFKYKRTGNDYLHAASVCVVSPDKKIVRYLNGMYYMPFEWKMAIVEASQGKSGPTLNRVLRYCYAYDPVGQTYVMNFTKVGGIIIMFFASIFLIVLLLKPKKRV